MRFKNDSDNESERETLTSTPRCNYAQWLDCLEFHWTITNPWMRRWQIVNENDSRACVTRITSFDFYFCTKKGTIYLWNACSVDGGCGCEQKSFKLHAKKLLLLFSKLSRFNHLPKRQSTDVSQRSDSTCVAFARFPRKWHNQSVARVSLIIDTRNIDTRNIYYVSDA